MQMIILPVCPEGACQPIEIELHTVHTAGGRIIWRECAVHVSGGNDSRRAIDTGDSVKPGAS